MVVANELRVGNCITHTNRNGTFTLQVEEVLATGVRCNYDGGGWFVPYDEIKGVPISDKILLKCESIHKLNGYPYKFRFIDASIKIRNGIFFFKYHNLEVDIEYLHQLQNLYFALTGRELDVKL